MSARRRDRRTRRLLVLRNTLVAVFLVSLVVALVPDSSSAASIPGSAGVDTSLPATDSQVNVSGQGTYSGLQVTVNQTKNLVNQAVSVTWTGAQPTKQGPGRFGQNYLQIMQCWGEDDGTNSSNPGPSPEQCEAGASTAVYGGVQPGLYPNGFSTTRVISRSTWSNFDPNVGTLEKSTTNVWRSFKAVDGTVVGPHVDPNFNPAVVGGNYWLNPYFSSITTNEIAAAVTNSEGKGSELFQVATGLEAPGLGCGQKVEPVAGSTPKVPKCWLVIVPRSDSATENAGTPFGDPTIANSFGVYTSPLAPEAWKNRIAVPLEFSPLDSPCSINAKDRRIVGSELVVPALTSWQPLLCAKPGSPPYVYSTISDAAARQQISNPTVGSPGMAVTPSPLDGANDPKNPTVYAPITLSGVVIGFNVERNPYTDAPQAEQDLTGIRVADINLTPRLVAKLLTQSYRSQVDILGDAGYPWEKANPSDLSHDPDFLRFNPEFALMSAGSSKNFGGVMLPVRNSDSARQVWNWILADPDAKAWLDGKADAWGMKVNPTFATQASANTTGVAFADGGAPDSFPKSDPYCLQSPPIAVTGLQPPPLCGPDWLPYTQSMRDSARIARVADDGAKVNKNVFAVSADQIWTRDVPQVLGRRSILSFTDTASASLFGLQTAHLSRAGDDGSNPTFVAPDTKGLTAGLSAMKAGSEASVLEPDPTASVSGAYPLTSLTYAAVRPLGLDDTARSQYADFIDYAAGAGQTVGLAPGQLPQGYAPLPGNLKSQATEAATTIRTLQAPPADTSGSSSSSGDTASGASSSSGSFSSASKSSTPTTAAAAAVAAVVPVETAAAAPEAGPLTPILALARNRFFIPVLAGLGVIAALLALEVTKRPRRPSGKPSSSTPGGTS